MKNKGQKQVGKQVTKPAAYNVKNNKLNNDADNCSNCSNCTDSNNDSKNCR